jgi:uncharacterized membrane protein
MRTLTLSLLILGAWLLVVGVETGILLPGHGFRHEDLMAILLCLSPALIVGLTVGCFVTRERPFRPVLPIVAIVASVLVIFVLFVALSIKHADAFVQAIGGALLYFPAICIFSVPAAITCLWAQACRRYCMRRR